MSNFFEMGRTAVQFLAEGNLIERNGEFYTIRFVDDNFAYSGMESDRNTFDVFMKDEAGKTHKFTAFRDTMISLFEEVTAEEWAAILS